MVEESLIYSEDGKSATYRNTGKDGKARTISFSWNSAEDAPDREKVLELCRNYIESADSETNSTVKTVKLPFGYKAVFMKVSDDGFDEFAFKLGFHTLVFPMDENGFPKVSIPTVENDKKSFGFGFGGKVGREITFKKSK